MELKVVKGLGKVKEGVLLLGSVLNNREVVPKTKEAGFWAISAEAEGLAVVGVVSQAAVLISTLDMVEVVVGLKPDEVMLRLEIKGEDGGVMTDSTMAAKLDMAMERAAKDFF